MAPQSASSDPADGPSIVVQQREETHPNAVVAGDEELHAVGCCGNCVARQSGDVHVSHCWSRSRGSPAPIALVIRCRRRDLKSGANVRGCLAARRTASVGVGGRAREQHDRTLRERAEVGQLGHSFEHRPFLTGEVRLFAIRRAEQRASESTSRTCFARSAEVWATICVTAATLPRSAPTTVGRRTRAVEPSVSSTLTTLLRTRAWLPPGASIVRPPPSAKRARLPSRSGASTSIVAPARV